jgi:hypothetical protein
MYGTLAGTLHVSPSMCAFDCRYQRPYIAPSSAQKTLLMLHFFVPACLTAATDPSLAPTLLQPLSTLPVPPPPPPTSFRTQQTQARDPNCTPAAPQTTSQAPPAHLPTPDGPGTGAAASRLRPEMSCSALLPLQSAPPRQKLPNPNVPAVGAPFPARPQEGWLALQRAVASHAAVFLPTLALLAAAALKGALAMIRSPEVDIPVCFIALASLLRCSRKVFFGVFAW